MSDETNLFGLDTAALAARLGALGLPAYRGRQIYRWIYARGATDFAAMTDLPRPVREELARRFAIRRPRLDGVHRSRDGTEKLRFVLDDGLGVEAVSIPDPPRRTVCLSTQVGCPLACTFCYSGTVRLRRNLAAGEIVGQLLGARARLDPVPARLNVVFMGMGEPLLNVEEVIAALRLLTDPTGIGLSPRRITVSTAGLVPELERLAAAAPRVGLAVSLHATTNELRSRLMPVNRRYPIEDLLAAVRRLDLPRRRRVTFEYVLLDGENDTPEDARRLVGLLRGLPAKVNLIEYNPWPGAPHRRTPRERVDRFAAILAEAGLTVSVRRSRGEDILAACGQLADRTPVAS